MMNALIFIGFGLLLVLLEFVLPGGVVGAVGAVLVAVGLVLFGAFSPSPFWTASVALGTLVLLSFAVFLILKRLRRSKKGGGIYLQDDQEGYYASSWAEELIGEEGEVVSPLRPSGHIELKGERYQAVSSIGYFDLGTKVIVIGGEGSHLIVKKKEIK
ncbi:MAG: serine protease [Verrucomicrobia bacterium]|nr:serine protease [Verrucomicrobiota bacterium]